MKEEEESAASSARRQHTLEGMSDNLFLDELLSDLERQILLRHGLFQKLKRAYGLLDRRPGHFDPLQPWDLFQAMVNEGRLSSSDVLCLQLLLHKCGSPDLADLVAKHAKKMEEEHGIHMMYFCVPVLEPTQGHRYVSLHVTKPDVDAGSQGFLQKLARLLHVGVEMVRVVGCQLTGSVWVTLLLPQACVVTLEAALERGDHKMHWQLAVLGVDHVSTIQVAPDPTRRDLFEAAARGQKYEKEVDLEEVLKESMNFLKNAPDPNDLDPDWDRAPAAGKTGTAGHTQPSGRRQEPGKARSKGSRISGPKAEAAMM